MKKFFFSWFNERSKLQVYVVRAQMMLNDRESQKTLKIKKFQILHEDLGMRNLTAKMDAMFAKNRSKTPSS